MVGDDADAVTHDTLMRGRIKLIQPARGFRSSLDPVLLAAFVRPPFGRFLDVGCGTGAIAFMLLARDPQARGVGVEIQPRLARLAEEGRAANGFIDRFEVRLGDARAGGLGGDFDLVVINPPYRPIGAGVLPPDGERSRANHEVTLALDEWLDVAASALRPGGRLAVVYPAARLEALREGLGARGLALRRLRPVAPRAGSAAQRVLLEACRVTSGAAGGVALEPLLVVHEGPGFSPEVRRMLGEDDS